MPMPQQLSLNFNFGTRQKSPNDTARETEFAQDSICDDDTSRGNVKVRPGETKEEALERVKKYKELKRIEKLMKFAFPRQRENHQMKKKVFGPNEINASVDLLSLKRHSLRQDNYQVD